MSKKGYWPDGCEHTKNGGTFVGTVETDAGAVVDVYVFKDGAHSERWSSCLRYGDNLDQYATGPCWSTGYRWWPDMVGHETAARALTAAGIETHEQRRGRS